MRKSPPPPEGPDPNDDDEPSKISGWKGESLQGVPQAVDPARGADEHLRGGVVGTEVGSGLEDPNAIKIHLGKNWLIFSA